MANPNILDRIVAKSQPDINTGCWVWSGYVDRDGYGTIKIGGISRRAHRVAYVVWHGPIAEKLVIRHQCDNPSCVNPNHLLAGTTAQNVADRVQRGRSADQNGERNHCAQITARVAKSIFLDDIPHVECADKNGTTRKNVYMIRARKSWRSVTDGLEPPQYRDGRRG